VGIEPLDQAMVELRHADGTAAAARRIGLDVADKVSHVLGAAFGDRVEPAGVLEAMVQGGRTGGRAGSVSIVTATAPRRPIRRSIPWPIARRATSSPAGPDAWRERMLLAMVDEAARCLEENVVESPAQVDLAMLMGTGFPPFRGGCSALRRHARLRARSSSGSMRCRRRSAALRALRIAGAHGAGQLRVPPEFRS
jgi:3-hydroxyacyl-CoA dehydrogenase/enoyl-CoA hydratase/3-hydroxybutyryl-CoA epimerase